MMPGWGQPFGPAVVNFSGTEWDAEFTLCGVNPEPWTPGSISIGRKGKATFGTMVKDGALVAYQNAVREWFWLNVRLGDLPLTDPVTLEFLFWRQRAQYEGPSGKMVRKSACDVTNLQKALEDALGEGRVGKETRPGILFKNDKQVVDIHSVMVEQGYDTVPKIIIRIKYHLTQGETA